jgi:predicted PurR-regulated permease PerM
MKSISIPIPEPRVLKRILLWVAGILLLAYMAYTVREIWLPLGLAFLIAMMLDPVVDRMELRGWSRAWASTFIFGSFLIIVGGLAFLAVPYATSELNTLQTGFERHFPDSSHIGLFKSFRHLGLSPSLSNASVTVVETARSSLERSSNSFSDYGMSLIANLIWIVIVPIVAYYALRDFHTILGKSLLLVPPQRRDLIKTIVTEVTGVFAKYLRGLAIVSALNGIATAVLLIAIGVPGGLVVGAIAGLLYGVPYLGALITLALTGAVAFVGGGPDLAILAVGLSVLLHQIVFDQIISPRVLGAQVGLHPILSIIALLSGHLLLGIPGMILAVPVAACIQIAVLAIIPKLSREVELAPHNAKPEDTADSLAGETTETHQRIDATAELHDAVAAAVESIEQEADEEAALADAEKHKSLS